MAGGKALLIDGNSLLYRAHFAFIRAPLTTSRGFETSGIFGFSRMLFELIDRYEPDRLVVAFDKGKHTFRHDLFADYKGTRRETPEPLVAQFPYARRLLAALGIKMLEVDDYEADDILGTLASRFADRGLEVVVVSGDRDVLQLVGERVSAVLTKKGISELAVYRPETVREELGVDPAQLVDVKALMGDPSDNIPGVAGVGEKTAAKLIAEHGSLAKLYERLDSVKGALRAKLEAGRDKAFLSKTLSTIRTDAPVEADPDRCTRAAPDPKELLAFFSELELRQFLARPELAGPVEEVASAPAETVGVLTDSDLRRMREALSGPERLAVAVLSEPASSGGATLLGVALTRAEPRGPVFYLPVGHRYLCCPDQLPLSTVVPGLGDLLAARPLIGHDLKSTVKALHPLVLALCHDTMLASYLLNPGRRNHSLAELAAEHLGLQIPVADGPGSDPEQRPVADAAARLARELDVVLSLERLFDDRLAQAGLTKLFAQVEMPLIPVLDGMERAGILVDPEVLAALGQELATELAALEGKIHLLCGETFNVNSPAQLSRILFEKLKCPVIRRTKTGYSTDSDVLLSLEHDHKVEVARHVNEYRHLAKLKGTYVDALPRLISPTTGRLHTTFNQVVTATGRLSSVDPNLQNIPVRTPVGMRIRRAFHAPPGHLLLSADYSQIELRILAHLADSGFLKAAFARDDDIHRRTAARMFGMAEDQVTPDVRSRAKAINFGILYGMSAYGLSREVGISQDEARVFMDQYFAQFPEVRTYIDQQLKRARENGFVTTLTGRRRYLPQIQSTNGNERSFAERTAVNTPVQGSAADLIKIAMLAVHRRLADGRFRARMLLQIHDELVFEVPEEEAGPLSDLVKIEMERAMTLAVNIRVDLKAGRSWADLK